MYNIMDCSGFEKFGKGIMGDSACNTTWSGDLLVLAVIFFLPFLIRKQCSDGVLAGTGFNHWVGLIAGLGGAILLITLTGQPKWALLGGLGGVACGFLAGFVMPTEYDGGDTY